MRPGSVYFLQVSTDGPIKIGFTVSIVRRRLRSIQVGSPHILRWIGYFEGTRTDERNAHKLLQNSSLRGEWFYPTTEVLAFVKSKSVEFTPVIIENPIFKQHHVAGRSEWFDR